MGVAVNIWRSNFFCKTASVFDSSDVLESLNSNLIKYGCFALQPHLVCKRLNRNCIKLSGTSLYIKGFPAGA